MTVLEVERGLLAALRPLEGAGITILERDYREKVPPPPPPWFTPGTTVIYRYLGFERQLQGNGRLVNYELWLPKAVEDTPGRMKEVDKLIEAGKGIAEDIRIYDGRHYVGMIRVHRLRHPQRPRVSCRGPYPREEHQVDQAVRRILETGDATYDLDRLCRDVTTFLLTEPDAQLPSLVDLTKGRRQ